MVALDQGANKWDRFDRHFDRVLFSRELCVASLLTRINVGGWELGEGRFSILTAPGFEKWD
jgi:hypothetical protein